MTDSTDRVARFIDGLIKNRRPPRFRAEPRDGEALRVAAMLRGAAIGAQGPDPAFVEQLHARLARAAQPESQRGVTRRRLLHRLGIPSAAALVGAVVGATLRETWEQLSRTPEVRELVPAEAGIWAAVAARGALNVGQPVLFTAGAIRGFLILGEDDEITAVSAVCTHLGCLLSADAQAARLNCPCHGAAFALDGVPLNPRYTTPLPRLRVRVVDDTVEVLGV